MLVLVGFLLASVAAANAVVDPTAQLGTGLLEPIAAGPRDRAAKVELLQRSMESEHAVDMVVLGSSRTKKLDPTWLDPAATGFNAAVVGGDLFEARVLTAWMRETGPSSWFPQLVVGIDVEQFRDSSLQGSGFLDVPAVERVARREAAGVDGSIAGELDRLERLLLTWQVTKASIASVRARARTRDGRASADATAGSPDDATGVDEFTSTGIPTEDAKWTSDAAARKRALQTPAEIDRSVRELRATYERVGARLDADAVADLRELVRIARASSGPLPLLYVTPGNPALSELDALGRTDRHAAVMRLLHDVSEGGRAAVIVDCSDCIDNAPTSWIDATHPSPLGARQLADALRAHAPSATPTERSGASR